MGHMKDLLITVYGGGDEAVAAAEKLAGLNRWIPVEERLPDHLQPVIGWHPGSYRAFGEVCWNVREKQWQDVDTGLACGDVTHWMKMPEPPEVK